MKESLPPDASGATDVNAISNWAKHGTHETATISEQDVLEAVQRAISKFVAVHGAQSPEMKIFAEWATERLQADNDSN
jgi:hypothetical protein